MQRIILAAICLILLIAFSGSVRFQGSDALAATGPYAVDHISITITNPGNSDALTTTIYFPSSNGAVNASNAPYPAWVFARGYQSDPSDYAGVAENLASFGSIVAVPDFPGENLEARVSDDRYLFSYLESENARADSMFFQKIDTTRFGSTGHSLGGATAMIVAARDNRIKATIALDPVNPPASLSVGTWDYETEAPNITAPLIVIGAPAQFCNSSANYNELYAAVGSEHKAKFVISNASHCDFLDTSDTLRRSACFLVCVGQFSAARVQQIEGYATAWLNYYLHGQTAYFSNLYGAQINQDIQAGLVSATVQTALPGLKATSYVNGIGLNWTLSSYPIIAGYNIYRSQQSGVYPPTPYAQVGRVSSYVDPYVVLGQHYFYAVRSRDGAGNQFQASEVGLAYAEPLNPPVQDFLPLISK